MTTPSLKSTSPKTAKLVPRLRFPEFEGEWKHTKLNKLAKINPRRVALDDDIEITFVPMAAVSDTGHLIAPERRMYGEVKRGFTYFVENDILIAKITPCFENGKRFVAKGLVNYYGAGSTEFHVIRPNAQSDNQFIFNYLNLASVNTKGRDAMSGSGGQQRVPADFYTQLMVPIPTLPEQQKIADCLSSLDDLITAEAEKLETLKVHKKGLMQELFPREGETTPRIRFPEFEGSDSSFISIDKIALITTGTQNTQNKDEDGIYPFFVRSQTVEKINSYAISGEAVLTSGDGVGVGENYHYINGKFDFHQRVYCIYNFHESINGIFFFYYFSTHFKKRVKAMSAKTSVDSVRREMVTGMQLWRPCIQEQQKIASALSSLDDRITAQGERIELLKNHKKGLMQQLFPVMEG